MTNKKICFITENFSTDKSKSLIGAAAQTYMLARGFLDMGWEVHLVSSTNQRYKHNTSEIYEGLHVYWWKRSRFLGVFDYFNIIRILQSVKAKVYYTRGRSILVAAIVKVAKLSGAITVWTSNGQDGCQKNGHIKRLLRRKKNILTKLFALPNAWLLDKITHWGIKNTNIYLTQTKKQQSDLKKYFKRDSVITKSGYYIPDKVEEKPEPPIVLYLSRLTPVKQPELFIEMANRLKHLNCTFKIAGGMHPLVEKILIPRIYKNNKIKYVGNVSFSESIKLAKEASVLINTSLKEGEGLSNSMVLAWLNGTPTITLDSDPDDLVKTYKLGFHSQSFEQMISDIEFLVNNKNERENIGRNAAEFARQEFDIYVIVNKIISEIARYIPLDGKDVLADIALKLEEQAKKADSEMKRSLAKDKVHRSWIQNFRNLSNDYFYNYVTNIAAKFFNDKNKIILDAGAGTATHSIRFAKLGYKLIAADISKAALEMAKEEIDSAQVQNSIELRLEDLLNLSFPDESFDYIYCWGVIIHIPEIEKSVKELSRILKPGGKLFLSVTNKHSFHNYLFRLYRKIQGDIRQKTETKYGTEIISVKPFGKVFTRIFNVKPLINLFDDYGIELEKRLPGQVTELYVKFPPGSFGNFFFQMINKTWIKFVKLPYMCFGNILLFHKPR